MFNKSSVASLVAALATASGVADAETGPVQRIAEPARTLACGQMRLAQVELYCDHPGLALIAIRSAATQLESPTNGAAVELSTLERAAMYVRRNETSAAVAALDVAMTRLAA